MSGLGAPVPVAGVDRVACGVSGRDDAGDPQQGIAVIGDLRDAFCRVCAVQDAVGMRGGLVRGSKEEPGLVDAIVVRLGDDVVCAGFRFTNVEVCEVSVTALAFSRERGRPVLRDGGCGGSALEPGIPVAVEPGVHGACGQEFHLDTGPGPGLVVSGRHGA